MKYEAQLVNIASQKNILNRAHLIDLMNLCSLHENMKSQYQRAAIDVVYFN